MRQNYFSCKLTSATACMHLQMGIILLLSIKTLVAQRAYKSEFAFVFFFVIPKSSPGAEHFVATAAHLR